ncbi:MAG: protease modulator HflC [Calditrichia bacterium]
MNNNPRFIFFLVIAVIGMLIFSRSAYTVHETEQVIITQFGKPVGETISDPGLHFKIPFIQKINRFDKRFLEWDGDREEIPTLDQRNIFIDTYGRWRITDPLKFFQRVRDERQAQSRLDDILDGVTRDAIASNNLVELIRTSNREFSVANGQLQDTTSRYDYLAITVGRDSIRRAIVSKAQPIIEELGIELLDLQFKRINYVKKVETEIFSRMTTARQRIAEQYRSEGQGEASRILGEKERDLKEIESESFKQAETLRGEADASATRIYAQAYDRNSDTREFYRFLKSMESYEEAISNNDMLILSTDNEFFKYLKDKNGR